MTLTKKELHWNRMGCSSMVGIMLELLVLFWVSKVVQSWTATAGIVSSPHPSSLVSSSSSSSRRRHRTLVKLQSPPAATVLKMSTIPGPEDDCASEEECEIDWDRMPGIGSEENGGGEPRPEQPVPQNTEASLIREPILYNDFDTDVDTSFSSSSSFIHNPIMDTLQQQSSSSSLSLPQQPVDSDDDTLALDEWKRGLVSLEMNWQREKSAEECNVDVPETCGGELCQGCQGRGKIPCRFCRGTRYLKFDNVPDFMPCKICSQDGYEPCHFCHGSGYIAKWTRFTPLVGGIGPH